MSQRHTKDKRESRDSHDLISSHWESQASNTFIYFNYFWILELDKGNMFFPQYNNKKIKTQRKDKNKIK